MPKRERVDCANCVPDAFAPATRAAMKKHGWAEVQDDHHRDSDKACGDRFHGGVDKVCLANSQRRQWKPVVYWLYGAAGVNKSRIAHAVLKGCTYFKPPDTRWFDGYDGDDVLVPNNLRKSTFTFSYLLDLLDRYDFQVEVKGSYVPMLAKVIIITCSKPHDVLWAELGGTENENLNQLTRRIHEEIEITYDNVDEQQRLVTRMRQAIVRMRDPANWDKEEQLEHISHAAYGYFERQ